MNEFAALMAPAAIKVFVQFAQWLSETSAIVAPRGSSKKSDHLEAESLEPVGNHGGDSFSGVPAAPISFSQPTPERGLSAAIP